MPLLPSFPRPQDGVTRKRSASVDSATNADGEGRCLHDEDEDGKKCPTERHSKVGVSRKRSAYVDSATSADGEGHGQHDVDGEGKKWPTSRHFRVGSRKSDTAFVHIRFEEKKKDRYHADESHSA
eukprot:gene23805-9368_t